MSSGCLWAGIFAGAVLGLGALILQARHPSALVAQGATVISDAMRSDERSFRLYSPAATAERVCIRVPASGFDPHAEVEQCVILGVLADYKWRVISSKVPKAELDEKETEYQRERAAKKAAG